MTEFELTRRSGDRRLYSLEGIGTVRLEGLFSNRATAEAAGSSWRINRRGFWQREIEATDAAGAVVGEFVPRDIRRGGRLRWGDHELTLRPVSPLRERYALSEDNRELVLLGGKGWGRRPVKITLTEPDAIEPGLLLFAAFVERDRSRPPGARADERHLQRGRESTPRGDADSLRGGSHLAPDSGRGRRLALLKPILQMTFTTGMTPISDLRERFFNELGRPNLKPRYGVLA